MTSSAWDLVERLAARGVHLRASGDRLIYDGPAGVVTSDVRHELSALKTELLGLLGTTEQRRPLELAEQQVWVLEGQSGHGAYVLTGAFRLLGPLNLDAFQEAVDDAVAHHAALRAYVEEKDGVPELVAPATAVLPVQVIAATTHTLATQLAELVSAKIDLGTPSLYRVDVLELDTEDHIVLVRGHHIVGDDFSIRILCEHVLLRYGEITSLSPPKNRQYYDLTRPQAGHKVPAQRWLVAARQAALSSIAQMRLPRPISEEVSAMSRTYDIVISTDTAGAWERLRREVGVTSFALVMAMLTVAVRAAGGPEDQLVGSSQTGRGPQEQSSIGYFARTIVVHSRCSGAGTFGDHARYIATELTDAAAIGDASVDEIVGQRAYSERGGCVLFAVAYAPVDLPRADPLVVTPVPVRSMDLRHDLRLELRLGDDMRLALAWRADVVSSRFVRDVVVALEDLAARPPGADEAVTDILARLDPSAVEREPVAAKSDAKGLADVAARRRLTRWRKRH